MNVKVYGRKSGSEDLIVKRVKMNWNIPWIKDDWYNPFQIDMI